MSEDLGPQPEPKIEPGEPNPGGVDAIDSDTQGEPTTPNLPTGKNPAAASAPDAVASGEDTSTQATEGGEEPMSGEEESPA